MKFFGGAAMLLASALGVAAQTYDYIVVGAGASGLVVADRLSESGKSVLLIERGHESYYSTGGRATVSWNNTITQYDVPGLRFYLSGLDDPAGRRYCSDTPALAGCILGGGTAVNLMAFIRPQDRDFDDKWPTGWKSADMAAAKARLYGRNPGTISPSMDGKRYDQGSYNVFSQFLSNVGFTSVDALANPNQKSKAFSYPPFSIANGRSSGPVMTYLPHSKSRSNFHLMLNTNVLKVNRNGAQITGVRISQNGVRSTINLNTGGKVVLAAGTMSTPRILFNSGIGPTAQIETVLNGNTNMALPPRSQWINLPVGQNLKNHATLEMAFRSNRQIVYRGRDAFVNPSQLDQDLFELQGSGILSQSGQRLNFWTDVASPTDNSIRFFQGTVWGTSTTQVHLRLVMTHGTTSHGVLGIDANGNTVFQTAPEMRTPADRQTFTKMVDQVLGWTRQSGSTITYTGSGTGSTLVNNVGPGLHYVGTCKMGQDDGRNGGTSVVDLNTKVYGTNNLFVVDGSFHPDLPTGNTQAIIMVAAEQAAAKILALG